MYGYAQYHHIVHRGMQRLNVCSAKMLAIVELRRWQYLVVDS